MLKLSRLSPDYQPIFRNNKAIIYNLTLTIYCIVMKDLDRVRKRFGRGCKPRPAKDKSWTPTKIKVRLDKGTIL
jgi:hypothetical protein